MEGETLNTVGINHSFKEFCFKDREINGMVAWLSDKVKRRFFLICIGEITICLNADKNDLVERMWERKGRNVIPWIVERGEISIDVKG